MNLFHRLSFDNSNVFPLSKKIIFCCRIALPALYFSCGKLDEVHYVVGLNLCLVRGFVAVYLAAFGAFVKNDVALLRVGNDLYGVHYRAAFARSVAGVNIYVERAEALRAMVARGVAEGFYLKAAVGADKAVIVFCKKLLFHILSFIQKGTDG